MILFCFFVSKNYWRWKVILRFSFWKFAQRPPTKLSTMVTNNNTDALFFWWAHILAMIMLFHIECYRMWYVENKIFKWFFAKTFTIVRDLHTLRGFNQSPIHHIWIRHEKARVLFFWEKVAHDILGLWARTSLWSLRHLPSQNLISTKGQIYLSTYRQQLLPKKNKERLDKT